MDEKDIDTEKRIKAAARKQFLEHGYKAKIRAIAIDAEVGPSMIHYYFRTKDLLFRSIYLEVLNEVATQALVQLNQESSLEIKIAQMAEFWSDFAIKNPLVSLFLLKEGYKGKASFIKEVNIKNRIEDTQFFKQINEQVKKGTIRVTDPFQLFLTIIGSIVFPVVGKEMITLVGPIHENDFSRLIEARKQIIPHMIMAYLHQEPLKKDRFHT